MQKFDIKRGLTIGGCSVLVVYLIANIAASQYIPDMFAQLFGRHRDAEHLVSFIIRAKDLEMYRALAPEIVQIERDNDATIYQKDRERAAQIARYEQLLKTNPKAPQILYNLHALYKEAGDLSRADEMLRQARELDPALKAQ